MNEYMNKGLFTHKEDVLMHLGCHMIIASLEVLEKKSMQNRRLEKPW